MLSRGIVTHRRCVASEDPAWVLVDDQWDPIDCGGTDKDEPNVFVYVDPTTVPPGATIEACTLPTAKKPDKWTAEQQLTDGGRCRSVKSRANNITVYRVAP
jgi:hypothetical protein